MTLGFWGWGTVRQLWSKSIRWLLHAGHPSEESVGCYDGVREGHGTPSLLRQMGPRSSRSRLAAVGWMPFQRVVVGGGQKWLSMALYNSGPHDLTVLPDGCSVLSGQRKDGAWRWRRWTASQLPGVTSSQ